MPSLRAPELRRFATASAELAGVPEEGFSDRVLRALSRLIPVDRASYNEVDRAAKRVIRAHSLGEPAAPELVASLNAHIHEHPVFAHPLQSGAWPPPMMISDFLTQRQFRSTGLWQEHFRLYGIRDQLGANFAVGRGRKIAFGLNRRDNPFTESERLMLDLIRPHIARARIRTERTAAWREAVTLRDDALAASDAFVALLDAAGEVAYATPPLAALLGTPPRLPASLRAWLALSPAVRGGRSGVTRLADWAGRAWRVDLLENPASPTGEVSRALRFRPQSGPEQIPRLARGLGLGPREAEVLYWVAQGKRNAEVAVIAGMCEATVAAHLRRLLARLGAETRTGAAAIAWEQMNGE